MNQKIFLQISVIVILSFMYIYPITVYPAPPKDISHFDKTKLTKGCGSCHVGHGVSQTPMLPSSKETFCFRCHGNTFDIQDTKRKGYLANDVRLNNIQKEFEKPYHHPVEKTGIHEHTETLPEADPSMPRHSECVDCHHHHFVKPSNKTLGIRGVNAQGAKVERITSEYELCFKCHSYSANLPADQTNKAEIFLTTNPSYHPVIGPGRNSDVPSLIRPLTISSTIKCTNCHNNNDSNGPKGPHGSEYRYILCKNYQMNDGPEGVFEYELCYQCHSRQSILGNRSFFYHNLHISVIGASCKTCHNPHGSIRYAHLIDFDSLTVRPSGSNKLDFIDLGSRAGECYLTCHGKNHDPATYPGK